MIVALMLFGNGLVCTTIGFVWGRFTARPRDPETDAEHAQIVQDRAGDLNIAMHNARAAGLSPQIKISPLDNEVYPSERPFRVALERNGERVVV